MRKPEMVPEYPLHDERERRKEEWFLRSALHLIAKGGRGDLERAATMWLAVFGNGADGRSLGSVSAEQTAFEDAVL